MLSRTPLTVPLHSQAFDFLKLLLSSLSFAGCEVPGVFSPQRPILLHIFRNLLLDNSGNPHVQRHKYDELHNSMWFNARGEAEQDYVCAGSANPGGVRVPMIFRTQSPLSYSMHGSVFHLKFNGAPRSNFWLTSSPTDCLCNSVPAFRDPHSAFAPSHTRNVGWKQSEVQGSVS